MKNVFPKPDIITSWLEENGDPEITKQVEREAKELMKNNKQSSINSLYYLMFEKRGRITLKEFNQAKDKHKEEIMDAYIEGFSATKHEVDSVEYYNENYNTQENNTKELAEQALKNFRNLFEDLYAE